MRGERKMANEGTSNLIGSLKGKKIDVTTAAGAHIVGNLKDADNDYLLMHADDQELLVPRTAVALMTITARRPGEMGMQETA
jgi:hypothetical protein